MVDFKRGKHKIYCIGNENKYQIYSLSKHHNYNKCDLTYKVKTWMDFVL